MSDFNCEHVTDLLFDYAKGETSDIVSSGISKHLDECDECRTEYEKIRLMLDKLKSSKVVPDARLYNGVMEKIKTKRKPFFTAAVRYAAVAACIVIAVAVGLTVRYLDPSKNVEADRAEERAEKYSLDISDLEGAGTDADAYIKEIENVKTAGQFEDGLSEEKADMNGLFDGNISEGTPDTDPQAAGEVYGTETTVISEACTDAAPEGIENESYAESVGLQVLNFYSISFEDAENVKGKDTCSSDDEDIEGYYKVSELAAERYGDEYSMLEVYRDSEKELWVVVIYSEEGELAAKYTYDDYFALMSVETDHE